MSATRVNRPRLELELARRGWSCSDLARAAGISAATLSGAINGRPIRNSTLYRIVVALDRQPALIQIDGLLHAEVLDHRL